MITEPPEVSTNLLRQRPAQPGATTITQATPEPGSVIMEGSVGRHAGLARNAGMVMLYGPEP